MFLHFVTLWLCRLTFWPKNHVTSRISRGHCLYQVWRLWNNLFMRYSVECGHTQTVTDADEHFTPAIVVYCRYFLLPTSHRMSLDTTKWSQYFCLPSTCTATISVQKICRWNYTLFPLEHAYLNREVAGSSPGRSAPRNNSGQVVHIHVPLFTEQYKLVPVQAGS